ncbi:hypothetical protein Y032_1004g3364 [Ancylostoma ceylanicum]|uniref:Uncharacterized protein n=1 Tax=Ancylostoma ceylanicum TaxID=53326 RepID=A0A016W7T0_9BILA|nr:hypothetical protein Y032_1004g3364 [Ancylostoma ceylanicum]
MVRFYIPAAPNRTYGERQSRLPLPRPQHSCGAGEPTPNIHSARPRRVDVAAAGVAVVIDGPCRLLSKLTASEYPYFVSEVESTKLPLTDSEPPFCFCNPLIKSIIADPVALLFCAPVSAFVSLL